jgi:hypothetical protein
MRHRVRGGMVSMPADAPLRDVSRPRRAEFPGRVPRRCAGESSRTDGTPIRRHRPAWRRPRVVLADLHRPRRDRPGLHCVPPRAGQASAHPRRVSHPPFVTGQQRLPGRPRIVAQGGGSVPRSAAGSAPRGMSRRESVPARPDRQSVCGRVLGHRSPNSLPSPRPGPRHHGRSACPCGGLRPGAHPGVEPRYHRVIYLTAPAARGVADRAAAALPPGLGPRLTVRDLPPEAFM